VEPEEVAEPEDTSDPVIAGSDEVVSEVDDTEVTLSTDRDPITLTATPTSTDMEVATPTEVADVVVTEDSVALYSDFISTSTGGIPATIDPNQTEIAPESTSPVFTIATQPQTVLQLSLIHI